MKGNEAPSFYFGNKIFENPEQTIEKDFFTGLIPNVISGNLYTNKVVVLNLNMGTGTHDKLLFTDSSNFDYTYSPTIRVFNYQNNSCKLKLNEDYLKQNHNDVSNNKSKNCRDYSFSTMAFLECMKKGGMKNEVKNITKGSFDINKAKNTYKEIIEQLEYFKNVNSDENYLNSMSDDVLENLKKYQLVNQNVVIE